MKGIILAGGSGTRLYPITKGVSKQLLPVYDKPMIYYPISVLMLAGIKDILIISTPNDLPSYKKLLGDGSNYGVNFTYLEQPRPEGITQAFIIGEEFIDGDDVCLILGDNIFWGHGFTSILERVANKNKGATIFGYQVDNPEDFGVAEFDKNHRIVNIQEKPENPKSNFAITGLYFYDNNVVEMAKKVRISDRGEFEITTLNQMYLDNGNLEIELLGRGFAWLDTGTHKSLLEASMFIETLEKRQGFKIACLEEISWRKGWISNEKIKSIANSLNGSSSSYGKYLNNLIRGNEFI